AALGRSCAACVGGRRRPHQRRLPGHHPAVDRARRDARADELLQPPGRHDRASPRRPRGRCGGGAFLAGRVGGLGRSALLSRDRGAGSAQPDAARLPGERAGASADAEQLHREHQRRSGRDRTDTAVAVTQCGRDGQLSPPADAHTADAFVPTLDDLAGAELEAEGVAAVAGAVELLAARQPAGVMDLDALARYCRVPAADCHPASAPAGLVAAIEHPRPILLMVKAGAPVGDAIGELLPHLEAGDIVIDGGNSFFRDAQRRTREMEAKGLRFIGAGVSGGEEGALEGPSIMPGGTPEAYADVEPILSAIAAQVDGTPCCAYIGPDGAGP